ncbi:MAG: hypothetical protein SX243_22435 [Acidobacteriota bacterium]|nr:hypothetical protein [Acidobacteriota bacterium]
MEHLGLWIGVVALAISLYAAGHARRSAAAAERAADAADRSARSAEAVVTLKREEVREVWIRQLAEALPDGRRLTRLLSDLPDPLRHDWKQLVTSAAGRNPRTPDGYFQKLLEKHSSDWERAAIGTSLATEARRS